MEDEDIPDEVRPSVAGIRYLYSFTLEPLGAPAVGHKILKAASKAVALAAHGAIHDRQSDEVSLPSGMKRFNPPKRDREVRVNLVSMKWWFTESSLLLPEGPARLVSILERDLPEALPVRYGLFEPPQHRYAEAGREHFISFLSGNRDRTVWYHRKPVGGVYLSCDKDWGWRQRSGFRSNRLEIDIDAAALEQPGWADQLLRAWRNLGVFLKPFYGEVRTLGGHIPSGGTFASDSKTEDGPTCSWWWRGIPRNPGYAVVLGDPYLSLWPAFATAAKTTEGLAFFSLPSWEKGKSVTELSGPVPESLAQRWTPAWIQRPEDAGGWSMNWNTEYPETFPFGAPTESGGS